MHNAQLSRCIAVFAVATATLLAHAVSEGQPTESDRICVPLSADSIKVTVPKGASASSIYGQFTVSIPPGVNGTLERNQSVIENSEFKATISNEEGMVIEMIPVCDESLKHWDFYPESAVPPGNWTFRIPAGYFKIVPDFIEVDDIDIDIDSLRSLAVGGAWHAKGIPEKRQGMFTIQDDDGVTGRCIEVPPAEPSSWGYFTSLYPVLESLGLKGTVSLEGRKAGFTDNPPTLNETGQIAKRLQDERGWEIQSHSMHCAGEILSCWYVDDLDSKLARKLLAEGNPGKRDYNTVSVYDGKTGRQYMPDELSENWVEAEPAMVKPYVGDHDTGKAIFYDPDFDVDYHWGEWFRIAESFGINGRSWVAHNIITSHALTPKINKICPNGFADNSLVTYNVPPLMSTASRCNLEGQQLSDYKGADNADNTYDKKAMKFFTQQLKEASEKGGWIVFALHAYRKCWKNYLPGALVSEGGTYPDAWVSPMSTIKPLESPLTPPDTLGIASWSEWHPCPGTRLYMIWELFKMARDMGMLCVTSAEGYEKIGNRESAGYFTNGIKIGYNEHHILGTASVYPHFIVSADGEKSYFNPIYSDEITIEGIVSDGSNLTPPEDVYSIDGMVLKAPNIRQLPKGIWILNGKKYLITH